MSDIRRQSPFRCYLKISPSSSVKYFRQIPMFPPPSILNSFGSQRQKSCDGKSYARSSICYPGAAPTQMTLRDKCPHYVRKCVSTTMSFLCPQWMTSSFSSHCLEQYFLRGASFFSSKETFSRSVDCISSLVRGRINVPDEEANRTLWGQGSYLSFWLFMIIEKVSNFSLLAYSTY